VDLQRTETKRAALLAALLAAAALLPLPMTAIELCVGAVIIDWLTRGLVPPDVGFNRAGDVAREVVTVLHFGVTPLLALASLALGVRSVRGYMLAMLPVAGVFTALSVGGFVFLIPRFFNE
jgi:hypothetical protein